jgi:hypothetical protein
MTSVASLKCPVCKARQELQSTCRRCGADLALYLQALRSVEIARRQYRQARQNGSPQQAAGAISYLTWLKPDVARNAQDCASQDRTY